VIAKGGGGEHILNLITGTVAQICDYTKILELHTLKGRVVWNENSLSKTAIQKCVGCSVPFGDNLGNSGFPAIFGH
jgi:hypothetical protein